MSSAAAPPWSRPPTVLVVVPARDEADHVEVCLSALRSAARYAVATGRAARVAIVLVAHRCHDDTAERARRVLGAEGTCVVDGSSTTVGAARRTGVAAGVAAVSATPAEDLWIFSTDADSKVPVDWIASGLAIAADSDALLVLGVTELSGAGLVPPVLERYADLLRAERRGPDDHDHVYGANLAIRADTYAAVGGFRDLPVGEDVALAAACRSRGFAVATPTGLSVSTSARVRGRAAGGLADVLLALAEEPAS